MSSANRWNLPPQVILCSDTRDKPLTLHAQIASLPANDLLVCTDAFDVLCVGAVDHSAAWFRRSGKTIVFGAERVCFHHLRASKLHFEAVATNSPYIYLNGGCFMGYAGAVRSMLSTIIGWDHRELESEFFGVPDQTGTFNDQTLFGHFAATHSDTVGLDSGVDLCWNLAGECEAVDVTMKVLDDGVHNIPMGSRPSFIHVTQVRKFYPTFLSIAHRLGLPLNGQTVDLRLFDNHLNKSVTDVDEHVVAVPDDVRAVLQCTLRYRIMKKREYLLRELKRLRIAFGRKRRTLFRAGD